MKNTQNIYSCHHVLLLLLKRQGVSALEKQDQHSVPCKKQTCDISRRTYQVIKTNTWGRVKRGTTLTRQKLTFILKAYVHSKTPSMFSMNNYSPLVNLPAMGQIYTSTTGKCVGAKISLVLPSSLDNGTRMSLRAKASDIALHYTYIVLYMTPDKSI